MSAREDAAFRAGLERGRAAPIPIASGDLVIDTLDTLAALHARFYTLLVRHEPAAAGQIGRLSAREHQVLAALAAGHTAPETARELHVSVSTVKHHRIRLFAKLGATKAAQAVAIAYQTGILPAGTGATP